ncbi:MAG: SLC13 family permease, partial [bacterium]
MKTRNQPLNPLVSLGGAILLTVLAYVLMHYAIAPEHWIFGSILLIVLVMIASGKMDKTVTVMIGSGVCLFLATAGGHLGGGHGGDLPAYVHMIEWSAVGIIIGATIFVELASHSGVFSYISIKLLQFSRGRPVPLLGLLALLTLLFSAFLDNVTAMIIVGSLTIIAAEKLELNPVPFVITEALMTNVGGTMTLISSIPNIIIGTKAGLSYLTILIVLTPYALVSMLASIGIAVWLFPETFRSNPSSDELENQARSVRQFDAWETVNDLSFFVLAIICVLSFIGAFAFHGILPVVQELPLEWIALGFGTLMLVIFP